MKLAQLTLLIVGLVSLINTPVYGLNVNAGWTKVVGQCKAVGSSKHVWIFEQWHLAPSIDTKKHPSVKYPQEPNQFEIYQQLSHWVEQGNLDVIVSEGCSGGAIDAQFAKSFNGWDFADLKSKNKSADYDHIVTLIPLKLKAKYGSAVSCICGDDEQVLSSQNSALSDLRGDLGYLQRLEEYKSEPKKAAPYLQALIQVDHLSSNTTTEEAITHTRSDIANQLQLVMDDIDKRNLKFFEAINKTNAANIAVVVGGLHAQGLKNLLEAHQLNCSIVQTKDYVEGQEKLMEEVQKLVQSFKKKGPR